MPPRSMACSSPRSASLRSTRYRMFIAASAPWEAQMNRLCEQCLSRRIASPANRGNTWPSSTPIPASTAERRSESRGQRDGFQALTIDAMRQPAFDRAALSGALEQRRESTGDLILDMTEDLHVFLAGLTPEQKAAFLERAERERDFLRRLLFPPRPRPDGDGPAPPR